MGVVISGNYDIAVAPAGDIFLAGDFTSSVSFGIPALTGKGGKDIFIAKLDPMGGHVWSESFGSAGDQIATHIAVDMFGNPMVTGTFPDFLDLGNGIFLNAGMERPRRRSAPRMSRSARPGTWCSPVRRRTCLSLEWFPRKQGASSTPTWRSSPPDCSLDHGGGGSLQILLMHFDLASQQSPSFSQMLPVCEQVLGSGSLQTPMSQF